jgi:serine/threonine protein kinase
LVDFGFAEKINDKELVSKAGTPGFIPPEVFKLQPYSAKGDIFSLGVIFYTVRMINCY